ncbi:MAG: hypothetical protein H6713_37290 [Myxococcales bacterium]|nr:hypothetical protein [Myxococcales bacterium]
MFASAPAAAGGRLDQAQREASGSSSSRSSSSSRDGDSGDSGDGEGARLLLSIVGAMVSGASDGGGGGSYGGERPPPRRSRMRYRPYPYEGGGRGEVFWLEEQVGERAHELELGALPARAPAGRPWSFRVGLEGAFLPTNIARGGLQSRLMVGLFELNTSWSYFHEFDIHDHLVVGDAKAGLSVGTEGLRLHVGAGPSVMIDPGVPEPSQAATVGYSFASAWLEVQPMKPISIGLGGEGGRMPGTFYWRVRGTAGITIRRVELFAGYEHLQVGTVALGGPMLGVVVRI